MTLDDFKLNSDVTTKFGWRVLYVIKTKIGEGSFCLVAHHQPFVMSHRKQRIIITDRLKGVSCYNKQNLPQHQF